MEYREDLLRKLELAFKIVRKQLIKAREYQKKYYDKKAKLQGFTIGDKVYLHNTANKIGISPKFTKLNWKGPCRVLEKKSDLTYRIRHCTTLREEVVNVNRLKLAVERILPTLGEYDPKGEREETKVKGNGGSWVEEDQEEETLTDCGGVESGSVGLDGSKEVEGQGTVELTGERLGFSSPDTIVSPRKPQRTVDGAIAILDKALQGVGGEGQNAGSTGVGLARGGGANPGTTNESEKGRVWGMFDAGSNGEKRKSRCGGNKRNDRGWDREPSGSRTGRGGGGERK